MKPLGLGVGWRPELALAIDRAEGLGFVEVVAESMPQREVPLALEALQERGLAVAVHGVGLSLGGAEPLDKRRLRHLAKLGAALQAPWVSEHIAFVRAGGYESGHLLPVPRTRESLELVVRHVKALAAACDRPVAVENIAALFEWPGAVYTEAEFLTEVLERSGAYWIFDVSNYYANAVNHGWDPVAGLRELPLDRLAYVHLGGGVWRDGLYHDTHAHSVPEAVLGLLRRVAALAPLPGVLLERDDHFPGPEALAEELGRVAAAMDQREAHVR